MSIACFGQQLPLSTDLETITANAHIKDLDNEYNNYIGTWIAHVSNLTITLKITKVLDKPLYYGNKQYFSDVLIVQHKITDSNGLVLENYINSDLNIYKIISMRYSKIKQYVWFRYVGIQCGIGRGLVNLKLQDSSKLIWNYLPTSMIITQENCPEYNPNGQTKINLPVSPDNIIFTKQ